MSVNQTKVIIDLLFKSLKHLYGKTDFSNTPTIQGDSSLTIKSNVSGLCKIIQAIQIIVSTDATVANRYLRLRLFSDEQTDEASSTVMCPVQTASNTWNYTFGVNLPQYSNNGVLTHPLVLAMLCLKPSDVLIVDLVNGVAGDAVKINYNFNSVKAM